MTPAAHPARFTDSTPLLGDGEALRARAQEEGYLFFKRLLPAADVLRVRADILGVIGQHGWRQPGQGEHGGGVDVEAINRVADDQMRLDIGVSHAAYDDVQRLESVHRLPHHARLLALYRTLFGSEVLAHPRHIIRLITPHRSMTPTPPHQDFPLIQGTANTWTCWFPLGDCPREMGGLTVLRGSHRLGYVPIQYAKGAGGITAQLCPREERWAEGDYETGDVLTFPSYTVHRALRCQFKDQVRVSFDVRYQPADEPVEAKSLLPHCGLSWEEIYAGWQRNDLQYYWLNLSLQPSAWNDALLQPSRRIC